MFTSILLQAVTATPNAVGAVVDTAKNAMQNGIATAAPKETSLPLMQLIWNGGPIMIPIGLLSLLAIYFFFERFLTLNKAAKIPHNFMNNIKDHVKNGNLDAARALCQSTASPVARMIERGISRIGKPIKEIEESMESVGKLEINRLEKNISVLSLIGRIGPIFGFIGTIAGVIKIFHDISLQDSISIGVISGGLYQKMITSASGLIIGLLAFVAYYIVNAMLDKTINKMETASVEFIDLLVQPSK